MHKKHNNSSHRFQVIPRLQLLPHCARVPPFRHDGLRPTASTATCEVTAEAQRETKQGQGNKTMCCRESPLIDVLWCKTMTWTYCKDLIACHRVPICLYVKAEDAFITVKDVFQSFLCCSNLAITIFKHLHVLNLRKLGLQSTFMYVQLSQDESL